jgi:hypothetical protein
MALSRTTNQHAFAEGLHYHYSCLDEREVARETCYQENRRPCRGGSLEEYDKECVHQGRIEKGSER